MISAVLSKAKTLAASFMVTATFLLGGTFSDQVEAHLSGAYNYEHGLGIYYPDWMMHVPDSRRLSDMSLIMTHDTMTYELDDGGPQGESPVTQRRTLQEQLDAGVRALDIRLKWNILYSKFRCYHGTYDLGMWYNQVLDTVQNFLTHNPSETVYISVKHEWGSENDPDFALYMESMLAGYPGLFWNDQGNHNPTLGQTRGKAVMISAFNTYHFNIPSIPFSSFSSETSWEFTDTIQRLQDKWNVTKWHLNKIKNSYDSNVYFTGLTVASLFSKPWFSASGHTTKSQYSGRRKAGIWIEDWQYPDMHRGNCFTNIWGTHVCDVWFEGQNDLTYNYIVNHNMEKFGILNVDFPGPSLIEKSIELTQNFVPSQIITIKAHNVTNHCVRHQDYVTYLHGCDSYNQDYQFKLVPGLADANGVSFESVNYPGYYLVHNGFRMELHAFADNALYKDGATYYMEAGKADASKHSFRSKNYGTRYIRHQNYELWLTELYSDLDNNDATFEVVY